MIQSISVPEMWQVLHNLEAENCVYLYGGKAPSLDCDTSLIHGIDCSGFARYILAKSTGQKLIVPDGSYAQNDWCDANLTKADYFGIQAYGYGRLFWCFYRHASGIGHTWLADGTLKKTLESHGHGGPSSRSILDPVLTSIVTSCYELPCTH